MKKSNWLRLTIVLGVAIMLLAFIVVPDEYPWYYEVLLYNIGFWPSLLAKKELKKINSPSILNVN